MPLPTPGEAAGLNIPGPAHPNVPNPTYQRGDRVILCGKYHGVITDHFWTGFSWSSPAQQANAKWVYGVVLDDTSPYQTLTTAQRFAGSVIEEHLQRETGASA